MNDEEYYNQLMEYINSDFELDVKDITFHISLPVIFEEFVIQNPPPKLSQEQWDQIYRLVGEIIIAELIRDKITRKNYGRT